MSTEEINQRKKELTETIEGGQGKMAELGTLQAKMNELNSGKEASDIADAKNHRQEIIASFVIGKAKKSDVDQATNSLEKLMREAELRKEMTEAINSAIVTTEAEIRTNKATIDLRKRRLYEAIYDKLAQEIQGTINDQVNRCLVAVRSKPADPKYGVATTATMNDFFSEIAAALEKDFKLNPR